MFSCWTCSCLVRIHVGLIKCLIEIVTPFDTHVRTTGFHVLYICFCVFVPSAGVYMG